MRPEQIALLALIAGCAPQMTPAEYCAASFEQSIQCTGKPASAYWMDNCAPQTECGFAAWTDEARGAVVACAASCDDRCVLTQAGAIKMTDSRRAFESACRQRAGACGKTGDMEIAAFCDRFRGDLRDALYDQMRACLMGPCDTVRTCVQVDAARAIFPVCTQGVPYVW